MLRTMTAGLLAFSSINAFAHAGHDHSHWLSDPIHALTVLAIGSIVTVAVLAGKRKLAKSKAKK